MLFYSVYFFDKSVELFTLGQEEYAALEEGRLISTTKEYQRAYDFAVALAQKKQLLFVDHVKAML